jgi:rfaE bifunctional protein kinase chain/domain
MNQTRLNKLLDKFPACRILVVGDFFLDAYLTIDRQLSEVSLETGLEAYQVVGVRCSPGAAGTVTSNLRALGIQTVALGAIGDDGNGYELKRGLAERGVDIEPLIEQAELLTPTYTKPMLREVDGREHEIQRLDIKNRAPLPEDVQDVIVERLRALAPHVHGVIVADQVPETNHGLITDRVRAEIGSLALSYPDLVVAADSRTRIGLFRNTVLKPNAREAVLAVHPGWAGEIDLELAKESGATLSRRSGRPVFLTLGDQGILLFANDRCTHIPAVPVCGEIDIVGAGDSCMAGLVSALCCGATPEEAALIGNLVASITVQQIGTTGTATPSQVQAQFQALCQER